MKLAVSALIIAAFALSIGAYSQLPERVPIHWSWSGQADNYGSKPVGAFAMPATMVVLALLFAALPAISPSGYRIEGRSRAYRAICLAVLVLMLGIHVNLFLSMLNVTRSVSGGFLPLSIGAFFVLIGNYLPKMPRNFFVGVRTPWTLADEDVWFRTHRLGGVVCVISGVLVMAIGPFLTEQALSVFLPTIIGATALSLVIYSFVVYRRLHAVVHKGEVSP